MTEISPFRFVLDCLFAPRRGGVADRLMQLMGHRKSHRTIRRVSHRVSY